jgi:hypothetical protein
VEIIFIYGKNNLSVIYSNVMNIQPNLQKYTNFSAWLKKRVKANRAHFIKNLNLEKWPADKFLEYKNFLYKPLQLSWPEGRDYGVLQVQIVGHVRKLQSGPSTDIVPLSSQQIKIQVSHEIKRKKKTEIKSLIPKGMPGNLVTQPTKMFRLSA